MTEAGWKRKIKKACQDAGTYKQPFDLSISTLAGILALRDGALAQYIESGAHPVVEKVGSKGEVNLVKNPMLAVILDANSKALSYWRDLGLTPAGFRKLDAVTKTEPSSFSSMLEELSL